MRNLALIKLGGSVVTFKDRSLAANIEGIDAISRILVGIRVPMIIVHGGGSYGHYWSTQYNMHTRPAPYDSHGISLVHESMIALNQIIVNSMIKAGLNPYGMPPSVFTSGLKPVASKIQHLRTIAKSKVTPVTFGDVVYVEGSKYSILSGDALMTIIAKSLRPSCVIFATNVDGIYKDLDQKEIMTEINSFKETEPILFPKGRTADVTGGMQRKITEAFKITSYGMDVVMVNGLHPERISQAVEGFLPVATVVKAKRRHR
jgi:isopentenyl phosphate kinase